MIRVTALAVAAGDPCAASRNPAAACSMSRKGGYRTYKRTGVTYGRVVLHEFLTANRADLIERCRIKTCQRATPRTAPDEILHGVPSFLDQLIRTLQMEQTAEPLQSRKISGPAGGGPAVSEIAATAVLDGREFSRQGWSVEQVVHHYGDLCQAITDLAFERKEPIDTDEFRTLNRCLDNGIADAVTEFSFQRSALLQSSAVHALNERLGYLAHELRNHIHTATFAIRAIKAGHVGLSGATGAVLDRSLIGMRDLVDRSLADVRVAAGMEPLHRLISLADFIADIGISASLEAQARGCVLTVGTVDAGLAIDVDREMLFSAVIKLLQNAFKFTRHASEVTLNAHATAGRIRIDIEDQCGGLPDGVVDQIFLPFKQAGDDRSGLGLGLAICRRAVEANNGFLKVRDLPGTGCVFTIDLPRHLLPPVQ
jgi:signal transduction histidine kinase